MKLVLQLILISSPILFFNSCGNEKNHTAQETVESEYSSLYKSLDTLYKNRWNNKISYYLYKPRSWNVYNEIMNRFGIQAADIVAAINRVDKNNLRGRDTIVIPDTFLTDPRNYSPFPFFEELAKNIPKLILVSQRIQSYALYEYGCLIKWGAVSSGKKRTPTPNGLFSTNWKSKETISTVNEEWLLKWYFNVENFEGVSLHQYELPGYPASHACVRLTEADAKFIYNWAEQWILTSDEEDIMAFGTPVIIWGEYDYENPKVWKKLESDPDAAKVSENEIKELLAENLILILIRQQVREMVLRTKYVQEQKYIVLNK
ncbi:MAG: L,D-transpeptidase [Ignavibacteriaceae bacterium]|nr:L,D-transpeptidase [Ignavibacteriaceae bacterium]